MRTSRACGPLGIRPRSGRVRVIQLLAVKPAVGGAVIEVGHVTPGSDDRVGVSIEDPDAAPLQANRLLLADVQQLGGLRDRCCRGWGEVLDRGAQPVLRCARTGVDETPRVRLFEPVT